MEPLQTRDARVAAPSRAGCINTAMSYNLSLRCGCVVYVSCDPRTGLSHSRVIERRGPNCLVRKHEVGLKIYLWELLPEPSTPPRIRSDRA